MKKEAIAKFYLTYRLYIFPTVVALSSLILITFIIFPQISSLVTNQREKGDLLNKQKFLEVKAQTLENLDGQDLSNKVNSTLSSYPSDKDFGNVIGLIQTITAQSGFIVTTMSIGNTGVKIDNSETYNIALNVTGPKSLVGTFLSNIENSTRLMRVGNIQISNNQTQDVVDMTLGVDVLYAPVPNSFGSIDSSLPELSSKDEELLAQLARNAPAIDLTSTNVSLPARGRANPFE